MPNFLFIRVDTISIQFGLNLSSFSQVNLLAPNAFRLFQKQVHATLLGICFVLFYVDFGLIFSGGFQTRHDLLRFTTETKHWIDLTRNHFEEMLYAMHRLQVTLKSLTAI